MTPMIPITLATADLCDQFEAEIHSGTIAVLPAIFKQYGQTTSFHGQAVTVKAFEDNTVIKQILENEDGTGKVLVVDGGASMRCALVGGNIAAAAAKNHWAGIIVNGCVRDACEIEALDIAVCALGLHPLRSMRKGAGQRDIAIDVQGVRVTPNDWLYFDVDGLLISPIKLSQ